MGLSGPLGLVLAPVFFTLVLVEYLWGRRTNRQLYTRKETWISLVILVLQRLIDLLPLGACFIISFLVWEHRLFTVDLSAFWAIPLLVIATEFCYYWFHRANHEIRWMWATHAVHHSTEELNVLASYRLGLTAVTQPGWLFYLPVIFIGYHPGVVATALAFLIFYQSWLHTTTINKVPFIEGWLNTPSAHRVHHARNDIYLNRNYGAMTVVFDRLFGTYAAERSDEPCDFGLVNPVASSNPLNVAFHEWSRMFADLNEHHPKHWWNLMFREPGWRPTLEELEQSHPSRQSDRIG